MNQSELGDFFNHYNKLRSSIVSGYEFNLETFFDKFSYRRKLFYIFKKEADKKLSSNFNTFDFIKVDELGLSDVVSVILDPKGVHGQGSLFLDIFISSFGSQKLQDLGNRDFKVYKEYSANGSRRIDILLKNNDFAILIENKPYTGDQVDQITDYIEYMEEEHRPSYKGKLFTVYLNKTHSEPENFSDNSKLQLLRKKQNEGEFKIVSYDIFAKTYLKKCHEKCNSEKFRYFLEDFIEFIDKSSNFKDKESSENG